VFDSVVQLLLQPRKPLLVGVRRPWQTHILQSEVFDQWVFDLVVALAKQVTKKWFLALFVGLSAFNLVFPREWVESEHHWIVAFQVVVLVKHFRQQFDFLVAALQIDRVQLHVEGSVVLLPLQVHNLQHGVIHGWYLFRVSLLLYF